MLKAREAIHIAGQQGAAHGHWHAVNHHVDSAPIGHGKLHLSIGGASMRLENPTLALFTVVGLMATAASAQVVRQEVPGIRNFAKVETTVA